MNHRATAVLLAASTLLAAQALSAKTGDIVEAAKANDSKTVLALLESSNVNAAAPDGATALHWAAHWDDLDTAAKLVRAGADVSVQNRYGVSPLLLAGANGNAAMIELLIKAGADANVALPEGETALMRAARTGRADAVRALLRHGADVNAIESWKGQTALMWAAAEGYLEAVEVLVEAGAEIEARSKAGYSPLLFAVREGRNDVVMALLKAGADVNQTLPAPRRRYYGGGGDPARSGPPKVGSSALDLAISNAHFELASALLHAGADANAAGPGWASLHTISWVRKPGIGSNDPAPEGSGDIGSLELVRKLVDHGADVNTRMTGRSRAGKHSLNTVGATPFMAAARTADGELMRLLAELGADPLIPNENGTTPLMVAAGLGTRAPDEDAGAGRPEDVVEAVRIALELGGDPDAMDSNFNTAMHGAAYKHVAGAVRLLAEAGANIEIWNRKNHQGWTPLRIATGVHRGMNLRASPETAAAIAEVMEAAGVPAIVEPEEFISGATR